jgi:uncharacterized protein YdhG (YjbR/CyaY superfamily)
MNTKNSEQPNTEFPRGIGNPARSALEEAGYTKLKQLTRVTERELIKLHGMGPKALGILREELNAKGLSFAAESKPKLKTEARVSVVDDFMNKLKHPLQAEVQMVRDIIKNVNKEITEQIKWNAPTFSYRGEYLVTFNLWEKKKIHLVFHNPMISKVKSKLLEGDYDHRRMAYFANENDIKAKKSELQKALKDWIKLQKQ